MDGQHVLHRFVSEGKLGLTGLRKRAATVKR
jgi:hypothetical protein